MPAFEDHAHAALAERLDEPVRPKDELISVAGKKLRLLVFGEPAARNQIICDFTRRLELLPFSRQNLQMGVAEDLVASQEVNELVRGQTAHEGQPQRAASVTTESRCSLFIIAYFHPGERKLERIYAFS